MLACLLFHEFHELNKTSKLKGANMYLKFIGNLKLFMYWYCIWLKFAKIKSAKIILHVKSSFRAAKLKGFAVSTCQNFLASKL